MKEKLWKNDYEKDIEKQSKTKQLKEKNWKSAESYFSPFSPVFSEKNNELSTNEWINWWTDGRTYPLTEISVLGVSMVVWGL